MVPFMSRKLGVDTKEADELFDLGVKVFSNNGKISDEGLSVLLRQRDPKRQMRVKPSDFVDWSLLPGDRGKLAGPRSGFLGKPLVISIL
jgi:hypothetical protein